MTYNESMATRKRYLHSVIFHLSLNSPMKSYCSIVSTTVYHEINVTKQLGSVTQSMDALSPRSMCAGGKDDLPSVPVGWSQVVYVVGVVAVLQAHVVRKQVEWNNAQERRKVFVN